MHNETSLRFLRVWKHVKHCLKSLLDGYKKNSFFVSDSCHKAVKRQTVLTLSLKPRTGAPKMEPPIKTEKVQTNLKPCRVSFENCFRLK